MKTHDDNEIKELLACFSVKGANKELIDRTVQFMHEETVNLVVYPVKQGTWIMVLTGLAVIMSICLFYMLTVGTILIYIVPPYLVNFLRYSLFVFTAVCGFILVGAFVMFYLKHLYNHRWSGDFVR
jgi:hypothetical protein